MRSELTLFTLGLGLGVGACTFGGLGDYPIETCERPLGTAPIQQVGDLGSGADLSLTSNRDQVIAAYAANVNGGACVQAVGARGFLSPSCSFLSSELSTVPRQPSVLPFGAGYAAALVATTAPCTQGRIMYRYTAPSTDGAADVACSAKGAALPAFAPLGSQSVVAWYETSVASRADALASCDDAKAVVLKGIVVNDAASKGAKAGAEFAITTSARSIRPPAMLGLSNDAVLVASPNGTKVSLWTVDGRGKVSEPRNIDGLAEARAVAVATDGGERIAVAAEIGCRSSRVILAVGTLAGGFDQIAEVTSTPDALALAPSVAFVGGEWWVSWIASAGSPRALVRRFASNGLPVGGVVDPGLNATVAHVRANGDVVAFTPSTKSFVTTSLGCPR